MLRFKFFVRKKLISCSVLNLSTSSTEGSDISDLKKNIVGQNQQLYSFRKKKYIVAHNYIIVFLQYFSDKLDKPTERKMLEKRMKCMMLSKREGVRGS